MGSAQSQAKAKARALAELRRTTAVVKHKDVRYTFTTDFSFDGTPGAEYPVGAHFVVNWKGSEEGARQVAEELGNATFSPAVPEPFE